jgi:hypothetical protein
MWDTIVAVAMHMPIIGATVRDVVDMSARFDAYADPNVPMPTNVLDMFTVDVATLRATR